MKYAIIVLLIISTKSIANQNNYPFEWVGSFKLPIKQSELGQSRFAYTAGVITLGSNNESLYVSGHKQFGGIAQINIPKLKKSKTIEELNRAKILQPFIKFLKNGRITHNKKLSIIVGMQLVNEKLMVNAIEYYDADADNEFTTFIIERPESLDTSPISKIKKMEGKTFAAGWISKIPPNWKVVLNTDYLTGSSSLYPIFSRFSIGPSLYLFDSDSLTNDVIKTKKLMSFSLNNPLSEDLYNAKENQSWTANSRAIFGFLLPDIPYYVTIGTSAGHKSGIGYKLKRQNGKVCPGQCPKDPNDKDNYSWIWSLHSILHPDNMVSKQKSVQPIFSGPLLFIDEEPSILGADFDYENNLLYVLLGGIDNKSLAYEKLPIIKVYKYKGCKNENNWFNGKTWNC